MIRIDTDEGSILLKSIHRSQINTIIDIYNCTEDICYATGIRGSVTHTELAGRFGKFGVNKKELIYGIFMEDALHIPPQYAEKPLGVFNSVLHNKTVWIKTLVILPQFRNRGIGRRTVATMLQYTGSYYGIMDVCLSVLEENTSAIRFWDRQGFTELKRFNKILFEDQQLHKVIIMHKKL